jgi:hypothetical protein
MVRSIAFAALALTSLAASASAQEAAPEPTPERTSTLVVFGNDPCPRSTGEEIIVCARLPENERYRLPKQFREKKSEPPQQSWASKVRALEYVSRVGTPNSCSPVGTAGQTGCYQQFLRMAREEREQEKADAAGVP